MFRVAHRGHFYCVALVLIARQYAMHAERDTVMAFLSVCLSVCLSNAGIMSKRMDISSNFFHDLVGASF